MVQLGSCFGLIEDDGVSAGPPVCCFGPGVVTRPASAGDLAQRWIKLRLEADAGPSSFCTCVSAQGTHSDSARGRISLESAQERQICLSTVLLIPAH